MKPFLTNIIITVYQYYIKACIVIYSFVVCDLLCFVLKVLGVKTYSVFGGSI